ncbi:hypothetical protein AMS68_005525 [Peltaster fructicola]|uniref:Uncharacterized protein n=1 Tax=Peltaster fructicola TaxID=286661 RepID=A0A6H0XZI9_9PEZI|nr:hypothetical protein AMS68_005525 [Peltaster fructicola]
MALLWVDNTRIDRKTMTTIRSHAAKGRNIGKGRPRKAKKIEGPVALGSAIPAPLQELLPTAFEMSSNSRVLLRRWLNVLTISFFSGPLAELVRFDMTKSMWVMFMFTDEAYFHCTIAMLNVAFGRSTVDRDGHAETLQHLAHAFSLANKKLSGQEALADTSFATVVAITQYHRIKHDHAEGLVHLDGLERMVTLSGGIQHLATARPALTQKILRADLDFAMHLGVRTRFGQIRSSSDALDVTLDGYLDDRTLYKDATASAMLTNCSADLVPPLKTAYKLAKLIDSHASAGSHIDGRTVHALAILLGYRLVAVQSFSKLPSHDNAKDTILVGLFAFLAAFLPDLTRRRQPMPYLVTAARLVLRQQHEPSDDARLAHLWALLLCRTSLLGNEDDVWITPVISAAIDQAQITNCTQLRQMVTRLPWIHLLHDPLVSEACMPRRPAGAIPHSAKAFSVLE